MKIKAKDGKEITVYYLFKIIIQDEEVKEYETGFKTRERISRSPPEQKVRNFNKKRA